MPVSKKTKSLALRISDRSELQRKKSIIPVKCHMVVSALTWRNKRDPVVARKFLRKKPPA